MRFLFREASCACSHYKVACRLVANAQSPYPSGEQKRQWAAESALTRSQIDNFLINARKRGKHLTNVANMEVAVAEVAVADPYASAASMSGSALSPASGALMLGRTESFESYLSYTTTASSCPMSRYSLVETAIRTPFPTEPIN